MKKISKYFILFFCMTAILALGLAFAGCSDSVKLSFESNGGTVFEAITAQPGEETELPTPGKEKSVFAGWYTDPSFSGQSYRGKITVPAEDTTYYAKWEEGIALTLDLDGGALAGDATLWLAAGTNLYDAVRGLVPVKSGLSFGAWFLGDKELGESDLMPSSPLTLTAKYKVDYRIDVYLQNIAGTNYIKDEASEVTGKDYVGKELSPSAPNVSGFIWQRAPEGYDSVTSLVLASSSESNVYSFYYDRAIYSIYYYANAPEGLTASGSMEQEDIVFGGITRAKENAFSVSGYRFAGWATSEDGDIVYPAGGRISVDGNIRLYAFWDRGYTDRFGSDDLLFFPTGEPGKAILSRGGVEFEGTRDGDAFSFTAETGRTLVGKVFGLAFSYEQEDAEGTYVFYDNYPRPATEEGETYERFDTTRTLYVDAYLNAVYTEDGIERKGSLLFDPDQGDYLFTSDDGTSFHTIFQKSGPAEHPDIFSIAGDEFGYYMDNSGEILIFDGYGTVFLYIILSSGYPVTLSGSYYKEGFGVLFGDMDTYRIVCWINDTSGLLNGTPGWQAFYICAVPGYFDDIYDVTGYYVFADTSRGEYTDGEGGTLVLDGHGYFEDSAVYTAADGTVVSGPYDITIDFTTGTTVTIHSGEEDSSFLLYSSGTFLPYPGPEVEYAEYYLLEGTSLQSVLVTIFEEQAEGGTGLRTEIYTNNSKGAAVLAARGYSTTAPIKQGSSFLLYTFTRTWVAKGYEDKIASGMTFFTTSVSLSSNSSRTYRAYSVLERNGEKNYDIIHLPEGEVWASKTITVDGVGSLFLSSNGTVYECSFPMERDEYFKTLYGELLYNDAGTGRNFLYTLSQDEFGVYYGTPSESLPVEYYYFDPLLSGTNGLYLSLVIDENGNALYDERQTGTFEEGVCRSTGKRTTFGNEIFSLVSGGEEVMQFILADCYFLGITYPAYFPYIGNEGVFPSAAGDGVLSLDGYGQASYSAGGEELRGSYYFLTVASSEAGNVLRMTIEDGTEYEFEFAAGETVYALDAIYGTWQLVNGNFYPINNYSEIYFDGRGTYTITTDHGNGSASHGRYALWDAAYGEYILYAATIDGVQGNYNVRFMEYAEYNNYNCVVRDRTSGVYVDDDFNVLELNGFGSGTLRGTYTGNGNFYTIDDSIGFGYFLFTSSAYEDDIFHLLVDPDTGTFRFVEYENHLFYASDLDHIAFRDDGSAFLGASSGDYLVTDEGIFYYIYEWEASSYRKRVLPLIDGDVYVYKDKTYYAVDGTKTFTATGVVNMVDEDGEPLAQKPSVSAKIIFEPVYSSMTLLPASFEIEGVTYSGFSLNTYTSGRINPRVMYESISYFISFDYRDGAWSFVVKDAGLRKIVRNDMRDPYFENTKLSSGQVANQGGKLEVEYCGFGGYRIEETKYSGKFLYLYDEMHTAPISFENVPAGQVRKVGYINLGSGFGGYHDLLEIVFSYGEKTYAIDFFEYVVESGSIGTLATYSYILYSFSEYREFVADGYTVGVKYLLHSNLAGSPGYGDESALGKPLTVTLKKGESFICALDAGARFNGDGVWVIENSEEQPGSAERGYLVGFTYDGDGSVVSVSVTSYSLQVVGTSGSYYFYVFVDGEGNIGEVIVAVYAGTRFYSVRSLEKSEENPNVWTFLGRETEEDRELLYVLTFTKGANGIYSVYVEPVEPEE